MSQEEKNLSADLVAQAEAAVAEMRDSYRSQLRADAVHLRELWCAVDDVGELDAIFQQIFEVAHNIKGQAGSFGYVLITEISASLCDHLRPGAVSDPSAHVVGQHLKALLTIVEKDISGDGGEVGQALVARLRVAANDASSS